MTAQPDWRSPMTSRAPISTIRNSGPNVRGVERWISIGGGVALAVLGLKRRGLTGALVAGTGAALVARGATGRSPVKAVLALSPAEQQIATLNGWKTAAAVSRAVSINKPRAEVYAFFRDFSNLPRVMENIERIDVLDATRSRWSVKAPGGKVVTWDSLIVNDEANRRIEWKSAEGAEIPNAGTAEFRDAPGGRGTEVHVSFGFQPPAGKVGRAVAALFLKDPAIELRGDLKRMKMMLETGEIATSKAPDASPRGAGLFGMKSAEAQAATR